MRNRCLRPERQQPDGWPKNLMPVPPTVDRNITEYINWQGLYIQSHCYVLDVTLKQIQNTRTFKCYVIGSEGHHMHCTISIIWSCVIHHINIVKWQHKNYVNPFDTRPCGLKCYQTVVPYVISKAKRLQG